jgi:hypothetical protein
MYLKILIAFLVVAATLIVIVAARPAGFRVTRTAAVGGSPAEVFTQVNELHHWEAGSPWAELDPAAMTVYDGPPSGVGAGFGWAGNARIGEGRLTITESRPNELVRCQLDFEKPFKATHDAQFSFQPDGGQTVVTWTMSGKCNFIARLIGLVINCDKMVGCQFEKCLANLDAVVAKGAVKQRIAPGENRRQSGAEVMRRQSSASSRRGGGSLTGRAGV